MAMIRAYIVALLALALLWALPLAGQSATGELRLTITDPQGLAVKSSVELVSEANQYQQVFPTDEAGHVEVHRLPYGIYEVRIQQEGFAPLVQSVDIHSPIPLELTLQLKLASVETSVTVSEAPTLVDPHQAGSVNELGTETIEERVTPLPGRSMQELVASQPGFVFEGSGVLHPRGAEYQTQFVVDGIPLTDNRSPGYAPEIHADDVEDMKVYTAGIPAEFGRKTAGVIEVDTLGAAKGGFHGQSILSGGSYNTASAYTELQYNWKGNTIGVSGNGAQTDHYLNPVVPENFHNSGTTAGWTGSFERDLTAKDRLTLTVRHGLSRFQLPNELLQQNGAFVPRVDNTGDVFIDGGQRQNADNFETIGTAIYQHIFSENAIGWLRGMVREKHKDLSSNLASWPIIAFQHNDFKEIYFSGSLSLHRRRHEWKFGIESDNLFLHENFSDQIPDCTDAGGNKDVTLPQCPLNPDTVAIFDPATPLAFAFSGSRPQLEQSAYAQDTIRLGNWTVNAGLRWDHYQLIVNQNALSPRVAVSRYLPKYRVLLHASYDRTFQTPDFENILLSSSPEVVLLNPVESLRLPVEPSHGNYYEVGVTKSFADKLRVDVNHFQRRENNVADDDQLLSTAIAFPIAWDHDVIYGVEGKITVPRWWRLSGWVSYSYQVAKVFFPVTGGLFLGQEVTDVLGTGHFPATQDQRHTMRARIRYQVIPRLWAAFGLDYGSGLPFEAILTQEQAVALYGQQVIDELNFDKGRIKPVLLENATIGSNLYENKGRELRLQADCVNLSDKLHVIDFGGLFSGNAIGPGRSVSVRLTARF